MKRDRRVKKKQDGGSARKTITWTVGRKRGEVVTTRRLLQAFYLVVGTGSCSKRFSPSDVISCVIAPRSESLLARTCASLPESRRGDDKPWKLERRLVGVGGDSVMTSSVATVAGASISGSDNLCSVVEG